MLCSCFVDPNPSPPQALPAEVLAACDRLIVNEHEGRG